MRNLGNRITKHSPTRGYSMELAAAITVLLASQLGLPVSTTQCITGAVVGVALTNGDLKSLNWKQIGKIFIGWVLTVPCAGLVAGLLTGKTGTYTPFVSSLLTLAAQGALSTFRNGALAIHEPVEYGCPSGHCVEFDR